MVPQIVHILGGLSNPKDSNYRIKLFDYWRDIISFDARTDSISWFPVFSNYYWCGSISNDALHASRTYPQWALHSIGRRSLLQNRYLVDSRTKFITYRISSINVSILLRKGAA